MLSNQFGSAVVDITQVPTAGKARAAKKNNNAAIAAMAPKPSLLGYLTIPSISYGKQHPQWVDAVDRVGF